MADNPTNLPQLEEAQGLNRVQVNELFGAHWPASHYGIDESASPGLTLVVFEANIDQSGTPTRVGGWTLTLTASTTNYIYRDSVGAPHVTTSIPGSWPGPLAAGAFALYEIVCGTDGPISGTDWRLFSATTITGPQGQAGGAVTPQFTFKGSTTDSDPGSGNLRLNDAGQNAATMMYVDLLDINGIDRTSTLDSLDASGGVPSGYLRLVKLGDDTKWLLFALTTRTTATGYRKYAISIVDASGSAPFTDGDRVIFAFTHSGATTAATDITGNAATATALHTSRNINGVAFNGTADITVTAAAGTLSGTTLASGVVTSSLTSVGAGTIGTAVTLAKDTDGTLAANSDTRAATQKAVKTYVDAQVTGGASDVMLFKGVIDCSANPNYPAADAGNLYKISVAGKIGGASGPNVEAGDTIYCITDSTSSGTQAGVGANWVISQVNLDGAVTGPASATDGHVALFNGSTGKLIKDSGLTLSGTNTGDQTSVTGNAGTATALQTARNIDGQSFDATANITVIAPGTHAATGKTTPVDADELPLVDSAASNVLKKLTWANLKATAKTYFDTLYQGLDSDLTTIAGLTATTDSFLQSKANAWASRTVAQVTTDLQGDGLTGAVAGFRNVPQNSQSTAYTTVAADSGKHLLHPSADTTARTFTIDSNANVAYPIGTAITFVNQHSGGVITIAITTDTMRLAGAGTTGSRTLAADGVATALKITSTEWIISGTGLT